MTIELPEELAVRLRAAAQARGEDPNRYAIARLADALTEDEAGADDLPPMTEEDWESLARGIADSDAGRVSDGPTFFAELRQEFGLPPYDRKP